MFSCERKRLLYGELGNSSPNAGNIITTTTITDFSRSNVLHAGVGSKFKGSWALFMFQCEKHVHTRLLEIFLRTSKCKNKEEKAPLMILTCGNSCAVEFKGRKERNIFTAKTTGTYNVHR